MLNKVFSEYKRETIITITPYALMVYWSLSFIDSHLAQESLLKYFSYRFAFSIPMLFSFLLIKYKKKGSETLLAMVSMAFIHMGVTTISYQIGGIQTDYYFGIVIVSFLQFIFFPFTIVQTILLDIYATAFYFGLNSLHPDFEFTLFYKQFTNYLSFALLKIVAVKTFNKMLLNNAQYFEIQNELKNKKKTQKLMGDLCHLLNNPLHVTLNYNEMISKSSDLEKIKEYAIKSNRGIDNMKKVTHEMLEIYEGNKDEIDPDIIKAGTI